MAPGCLYPKPSRKPQIQFILYLTIMIFSPTNTIEIDSDKISWKTRNYVDNIFHGDTQPSAFLTNKFRREIDKRCCKIVGELLFRVRALEFAGSHRPLSANGSERQPGSIAFQLKNQNCFETSRIDKRFSLFSSWKTDL